MTALVFSLREVIVKKRSNLRSGLVSALLGASLVLAATSASAQNAPAAAKEETPWYRLRGVAELGFLAVLSHTVQFGRDGTDVDYVSEGGQDTLFPALRLSTELEIKRRHTLVFLYQPLDLQSRVALPNAERIDGLDFPQGTPVSIRYNFPFYRLSYLYNLIPSPRHELGFGLGLQIRNATIDFASLDGTLLRSNRNIGPVPLLKARGRYGFESGAFIGFEFDGFYAPISYLNGSDEEVTGALADLSLRAGVRLPYAAEAFVNLRYIGGGGVGQGAPEPPFSDGYNENWLHIMTLSLGAAIGTR